MSHQPENATRCDRSRRRSTEGRTEVFGPSCSDRHARNGRYRRRLVRIPQEVRSGGADTRCFDPEPAGPSFSWPCRNLREPGAAPRLPQLLHTRPRVTAGYQEEHFEPASSINGSIPTAHSRNRKSIRNKKRKRSVGRDPIWGGE